MLLDNFYANLHCCFLLGPDVSQGCWVAADKHHSEPWLKAKLLNLLLKALPYFLSNLFPVEDNGSHAFTQSYSGNWSVSLTTFALTLSRAPLSLMLLRASVMNWPTFSISRSFMPLVVIAGVPSLIPLGSKGLLAS